MAQKNRTQIATDVSTAQAQIDTIVSNTIQAITGDILNSVLDKLNLLFDTIKDSAVLKSDDITNTLISSSTSTALSAAQGKVLKDLIDALATVANTGDFADLINVPQASTTVLGVVELATTAESNALLDTTRAVTPSSLPIASETQKGLVERATQAEVNTGTSADTFISPATFQSSTQLANKANLTHTHLSTDITDLTSSISSNAVVTDIKTKTDFITITVPINLNQVPSSAAVGWKTLIEGLAEQSAMTAQLTNITHTAPSSADYAIQALTNSGGFGFVTADEGHTVLSVIANLQTRVAQLETKLQANNLIA